MANDMILLSADTSSAKFSVALLRDAVLVDEAQAASSNRHSSDLIPVIDELLCRNSYSIEDVGAFCVGLGPGSFTGLRIGITTMRALALTLGKPITGIPSIDSLAYNLSGHSGTICAIIDAKQNKLYSRTYKSSGRKIEPKGNFLLLEIGELIDEVKGPTMFVGDGIGLYRDEILKAKAHLATFAPESTWYPKAGIIARLGWDRLKSGKRGDVLNLSPIYIYPKECQVKI